MSFIFRDSNRTGWSVYTFDVPVKVENESVVLCTSAYEDARLFQSADVVLLCYSVADVTSYARIRNKWFPQLRQHFPTIPCILVGSKIDTRDNQGHVLQFDTAPLSIQDGIELTAELNAKLYVELHKNSRVGFEKLFYEAARIGLQYKKHGGDGNSSSSNRSISTWATSSNPSFETATTTIQVPPNKDDTEEAGASGDGSSSPSSSSSISIKATSSIPSVETAKTTVQPPNKDEKEEAGASEKLLEHGMDPLLLEMVKSDCTVFSEVLKQGMEEKYDVRVMIVGRAGVGKTTLTRRLLNLPINLKKYYSTNGVDVHIHSCEIDLDSGEWVLMQTNKSWRTHLKDMFFRIFRKHEEPVKTSANTGEPDYHRRYAKILRRFKNVQTIPVAQASASKQQASDSSGETSSGEFQKFNLSDDSQVNQHDQEASVKHSDKDPRISSSAASSKISSHPVYQAFDSEDIEQMLEHVKSLPPETVDRKAKVSVYDFAGQYIFHASHPTFLSPRAIYMLVFDFEKVVEWKGKKKKNKKDLESEEQYFGDFRGASVLEEKESIFFWLNVIYLFADVNSDVQPNVMLIGTHVDKLPKADRKEIVSKFLRQLRYEIAETPLGDLLSPTEIVVDNTKQNDESYSQIKAEIFRLSTLQPDWGMKTPTKWIPLEREIQSMKESGIKVLPVENLNDINRGLDVRLSSDEEVDLFLQFLHGIGKTIFFSVEELRKFIVLDPVWLIDALKLIISAEKFALNIPNLSKDWIGFTKTGLIRRSTIVGIFKEVGDPSMYENHDHVLRLMEKFLFIAAPVQFPGEVKETCITDEKTDVTYIMPCMVTKRADLEELKSPECCRTTTLLCMVSVKKFLPPVIFQKILAMCIMKWPITAKRGLKQIYCGACTFDTDSSGNYKLTLFLVGYAIHARIVSYVEQQMPPLCVCEMVKHFLVQSFKSILKAMGFSDKLRTCIQCPEFPPLENGGYLDTDDMAAHDTVTCNDCMYPHGIPSLELLGSWLEQGHGQIESAGATVDVVQVEPDSQHGLIDTEAGHGQTTVDVVQVEPDPQHGLIDTEAGHGQIESVGATADVVQMEPDPQHGLIDQKAPMTQEHLNHARLCNALVTVCADGLRDILQGQIPPPYGNVHNLLLAKEHPLSAIKQIRQEQMNLLFPDPTKNVTGTVDQFDITLLYTLIRNISAVPPPMTGWGAPPEERDTSLGANVERIRICRNKVNGHSVDGRLDDQTFEDNWDELCKIMYDIELTIGPKGYQAALKERKEQVLTSKEAQSLQGKLKDFQGEIKDVMERFNENMRTFQAIMEKNC